VDFGRAEVVVAGVRHKAALFVLTLPHSNARFGCLFPGNARRPFTRAMPGPSPSSAASRRGSATTTARPP
jgi:hypothetical protein